MTAIITCTFCGTWTAYRMPEALYEALESRMGRLNRSGDPDAFCSKFGLAFNESQPSPQRLGTDGWVEVEVPEEPVFESVSALYRGMGEGVRIVATEDQLRLLLPSEVGVHFWWESVPAIKVVESAGDVTAAREGGGHSYSVMGVLVGPGPLLTQVPVPEGVVLHLVSWLDPVGILLYAREGRLEIVRPTGGSVDPGFESWAPVAPEIVALSPETVETLVATFPVGSLVRRPEGVEEFQAQTASRKAKKDRIAWGYSKTGEAYIAIEKRAKLLAEVWTALETCETMSEFTQAVSKPAIRWISGELEETMEQSDVESLTDYSLFQLTKERMQDPDEGAWPYLGSEDEFVDNFELRLGSEVEAALDEAFEEGEIDRGDSMTSGGVVVIEDIEELVARLTTAGARCKEDSELIQAAIGPYQ